MKETFSREFKNIFRTQNIVAIAVGSALFGVLMIHGGIPVYTNTKLTSAYIIPVVVGALFGFVPAALVGFFGNLLADAIGGWGIWYDWAIGNLVAAAFIGSLSFYGARIREGIFKWKHAILYILVSSIGNWLAFGLITPIFTQLFQGGELNLTLFQAQWAVLSNIAVIVLVGTPILFFLARHFAKQNNLVKEK